MVAEVFGSRQVAVFLPNDGRLEVAAAFGDPLTEDQIHRVLPSPGELARLSAHPDARGEILVHALTAAGRPVGLLALSADSAAGPEREPLACSPTRSRWRSSAPSSASRSCGPG